MNFSPEFMEDSGSGKTRVLLWRAFNLIVYRGVEPVREAYCIRS